jgi:1-acyl-sn-glycerol-3-phosphate acyltransferase
MLRGYPALAILCLALFLSDPVQRFVIAPWVRLFPSTRIRVLSLWQRLMAHLCLGMVGRVGGARFPELPRIPGQAGILVVMNHQSLMDIPIVVASIQGSYPRIVTRKRYLRWIPLISHMVRLYQYPVVDPRANATGTRKMLGSLAEAARTSDVPIAIFPEGTRTKDGEIGRFKTNGLKQILSQRPWTVYVMVGDGYWQRAKFKHFLRGMANIRGRIRMLEPVEWTDPRADPGPFMKEIRERMVNCLSDMRTTA